MKKLFGCANEYVKQSDWKDVALIKVCLCSMGVIIGTAVPKKTKKPVVCAAMTLFIATYVPLMAKFLKIAIEDKTE